MKSSITSYAPRFSSEFISVNHLKHHFVYKTIISPRKKNTQRKPQLQQGDGLQDPRAYKISMSKAEIFQFKTSDDEGSYSQTSIMKFVNSQLVIVSRVQL